MYAKLHHFIVFGATVFFVTQQNYRVKDLWVLVKEPKNLSVILDVRQTLSLPAFLCLMLGIPLESARASSTTQQWLS